MADELPMPADQCQADPACLKEYGSLHYIPNSGLNYASAGFFAAILVAQIYLGIRHKTWGFVSSLPLLHEVLSVVLYADSIDLLDGGHDWWHSPRSCRLRGTDHDD